MVQLYNIFRNSCGLLTLLKKLNSNNMSLNRKPDPIAQAAEEIQKLKYLDSLFHPISHLNKDIPMDWLIQGFLPKGYLVLLASEPKEGKSSLATALALAIATGTPFAGIPTEQSAVLWLSLEEGPAERRLLLQQSKLADPATPLYTSYSHIPIDTEEGIETLRHWAKFTEAKLIIVDPLHAAHSGRSLNDGWAARKTLQKLREFCIHEGITAVVLHHTKTSIKNWRVQRVAENAQLSATASMEMVLTKRMLTDHEVAAQGGKQKSSEDSTGHRLVTLACRGRGDFANRLIHLVSWAPLEFASADPNENWEPISKDKPLNTAQQKIMDLLISGSRTSSQLINELQVNEGVCRNAITNLRRKNLVRIVWQNKNIRRYGLTAKGKEWAAGHQNCTEVVKKDAKNA